MARSKSSILTPADKAAVLLDLRGRAKVANDAVKALKAADATAKKEQDAAVKAATKVKADIEKAHVAALKTADKNLADLGKNYTKASATRAKELLAAEKEANKLTAEITGITNPAPRVAPAQAAA